MEYKKSKNTFIIRLERGEKILETLKKFCILEKIKCAHFSGIGALDEVELAHYAVKTKEYSLVPFKKPFEITNMMGNVTEMNNEPYLHCHITLSDNKMNSFGGHLKEGRISAMCEIFLVKVDAKVSRTFSDSIGLNLMNLKK